MKLMLFIISGAVNFAMGFAVAILAVLPVITLFERMLNKKHQRSFFIDFLRIILPYPLLFPITLIMPKAMRSFAVQYLDGADYAKVAGLFTIIGVVAAVQVMKKRDAFSLVKLGPATGHK